MKITLPIFVFLFVIGCASTPDLTVRYYPTKTSYNVEVTRSLACNNQNPLSVNNVKFTSINSADHETPYFINIKNLDGKMANTSITFDFYSDGRIKGINSSSEGKGKEIIESSFKVLKSITSGGLQSLSQTEDCDYIKKHGGKNEVLTLVYDQSYTDLESGLFKSIEPTFASRAHHEKLNDTFGNVFINFSKIINPHTSCPVQIKGQNHKCSLYIQSKLNECSSKSTGDEKAACLKKLTTTQEHDSEYGEYLILRDPGQVNAIVSVCNTHDNCKPEGKLTEVELIASQTGYVYEVPIPKAAVFGGQKFQIALDEFGSMSKLKYDKDTGIGQALNATDSFLQNFQKQTDAEKLLEIKTRADLIAQQERLAQCEADSSNCDL